MRTILSYPLQEEDRGLLTSSGGSVSTETASTSLEDLSLSEGDRYQVEYFQRQLNNATAQRELAEMQVEEAKRKLAEIRQKYITQEGT